ncbi:MAG: non-canonical purine NTP pyrophosphatase, partial [Chlamydiae bacterium]|nr:non-canonical purine NTP pyrophosphatase [Chlamydiota bacterium]
MKLVIASKNYHKIREFRSMLKAFPKLDILSLKDFPDYIPPEELGSSFEAIAESKALHAAQALDCFVLADDSGLVVPALHGEPGVYSARYAGTSASDADNRLKLIEKLQVLPEEKRVGFYECSLALASKEGLKKQVGAICEGQLLLQPRGFKGFGYDSLFIKYDYNKTFAELEEEVKNKI